MIIKFLKDHFNEVERGPKKSKIKTFSGIKKGQVCQMSDSAAKKFIKGDWAEKSDAKTYEAYKEKTQGEQGNKPANTK